MYFFKKIEECGTLNEDGKLIIQEKKIVNDFLDSSSKLSNSELKQIKKYRKTFQYKNEFNNIKNSFTSIQKEINNIDYALKPHSHYNNCLPYNTFNLFDEYKYSSHQTLLVPEFSNSVSFNKNYICDSHNVKNIFPHEFQINDINHEFYY